MRYSRNKEKRQIERQQSEDFVLSLGIREHVLKILRMLPDEKKEDLKWILNQKKPLITVTLWKEGTYVEILAHSKKTRNSVTFEVFAYEDEEENIVDLSYMSPSEWTKTYLGTRQHEYIYYPDFKEFV
ncbi:MAG TPA: hypothetical protein IAC14_07910 [Candidatus Scybalomonas excrementigallinarum]|nr:hypothetical protein [Candidatus Scybalomonas excrementigallinarum]